MLNILKELCKLDAPSGNEKQVSSFIINQIKDYADYSVDPLGNIIAFKKGAKTGKKVMFDGHMDEVGFIITEINDDGSLAFSAVGGILTAPLMAARVRFGDVKGVISVKPVHLLSDGEKKKLPSVDRLVIDIGAFDKAQAKEAVSIGDCGTFDSDYVNLGENKVKAKALDDRIGCAIMIDLIKSDLPYDACFSFSVQEEVGLRGARASAYSVNPDYAIVLEATTASDLPNESKKVCELGKGVALSFMDNATLYDKNLYNSSLCLAKQKGIPTQPKSAVAGGNNAGAIHLSQNGIKTLTLSAPCRYIHSQSSVADVRDIKAQRDLAFEIYKLMAEEKI